MPLRFNTLLEQEDIPPSAVRLLRHQDSRSERGRSPYALWRDDRPTFEAYQAVQTFGNRKKLSGSYWASFVVSPSGETLFAGLYSVRYAGINDVDRPWPHAHGIDPAGSCDVYELILDSRLNDLAGRLVIDWGKGTRSWIQRADNQDKTISEIRAAFREPEFPGFNRFLSPLSLIENLPTSWRAALASSRGIYLLTCPRTREQYVGSACGADGFFGRWLAYSADSHGGNAELKRREPSDYQVSVLEVAGSAAVEKDILAMEELWKLKLQSREMGLNRN